MKYNIDPTVDCVFKALLGSEENTKLLIHFVNAVMNPPENKRIISVELLNPYNEREFIGDKLSIVDIKARDKTEHIFQIEIQVLVYDSLDKRISYTWSKLYNEQLKKGDDYNKLKPVVSIWLLCENLFDNSKSFHNHFQFYDTKNNLNLNDDCSIHTLELEKFVTHDVNNELERWLLFFKDGKDLDHNNLPEYMNTEEMREAMNTLKTFSEKEKAYHLYQNRLDYIREQKTIRLEIEAKQQEKERAVQEKERAVQEKERAVQEKERAVQEKERAEQEKERAEQEKENAVQEKENAVQEKENAVQEKENAVQEKESAMQEKEKAVQEKENAIKVLKEKESETQKIAQALQKKESETQKLLELIKKLQSDKQ
ncbi:MAG: Rpn family recombination-promoting nuclease/putative transposase [Desulfobacterales bacterium]|nr:Rpn family recombination-promoting nuclease/putative transposase [Desulfobacterales bacterium]